MLSLRSVGIRSVLHQGSSQEYLQPMYWIRGIPAGDVGAVGRELANRWRSIPTVSLSVGPVLATSLYITPTAYTAVIFL